MSFIFHDLRCPDGHMEFNACYRRSGGPPACPECAEPRSVFYATREMAGQAERDHTVGGVFSPFTYDGERITSPEQWQAKKAEYARAAKIPLEHVGEVSRGSKREIRARADDLRHEAYEMRRRNGFDGQTFDRYLKEQRERKAARVRIGWTP